MHSANELIGADDTYYLYKAFKKFYDISIQNKLDTIQIIEIEEKNNEKRHL